MSSTQRERAKPAKITLPIKRTTDVVSLEGGDDVEMEAGSADGEVEDSGDMASDGDSDATSAEIERSKHQKSKKTQKRKHRATSPSTFGQALTSLLATSAPSSEPLALKPSVRGAIKDEKLEKRAREIIKGQRKDKEEIGHVSDVIGGWGNEGERALRKVAQRGVVKLFNAIQASQNISSAQDEAKLAARGTGKPTLPAPSADNFSNNAKKRKRGKDNVVGRAKEADLSKEGFLAMIRGGPA